MTATSLIMASCHNRNNSPGGLKDQSEDQDGQDEQNGQKGQENQGSYNNQNQQLGQFTDADMVLNLNGATYKLGEDASKLLKLLGEPKEVVEILSCYYDGYDKTYVYENMEVLTFPKNGQEILQEVIFYDDTYKFKGGVTVGSTKEEVIASYGEGFFMEEDAMMYNTTGDRNDTESPRLTFVLENNRVKSIDFFSNSYFS